MAAEHEAGVGERRLHAQPFGFAIEPVSTLEPLWDVERPTSFDEYSVVRVRRGDHPGRLAGDRPRIGVAVEPLLKPAQALAMSSIGGPTGCAGGGKNRCQRLLTASTILTCRATRFAGSSASTQIATVAVSHSASQNTSRRLLGTLILLP